MTFKQAVYSVAKLYEHCSNCVYFKEIDQFHSYICLSICSLGPRVGKASRLLRLGPSWICDEDSAIRHGRRLNGHNRGCG